MDLGALQAPCHLTEETKKSQSFGHPDMHCDLLDELFCFCHGVETMIWSGGLVFG